MPASPALPALRFMTCGSVDDGKSTLIGRLLFEQDLIPQDQLAQLRGTGADDAGIDPALLLDGLEAEREQGITIDVAYRYVSTPRRSFIIADAPGHDQFTRNMVTAASNVEFAILLVDARKGLLPQTFRHAAILSMLGLRQVALAVNKMDLVGYDQAVFDRIASEFRTHAARLGLTSVAELPVSALRGDNISTLSAAMPWHGGPTLLGLLETIEVQRGGSGCFRLPVQWVNRLAPEFRGYCGTIAGGAVAVGDALVSAVSGQTAHVGRIIRAADDADQAADGDAVTLVLAEQIDLARGDMLCRPGEEPEVGRQFAARLVWMAAEPLVAGRSYLLKLGPITVPAVVSEVRHRLDPASLDKLAARSLGCNDIGLCHLATARAIPFDPYDENPATGGFILIDRMSGATAAAGMIDFQLRRSRNVRGQRLAVPRERRVAIKHHAPRVLWFTGLSGAGKSTIANLVEAKLNARGVHTMLLDGDNIRLGLNRDLGFTEQARIENIRRAGEVAKLMTDAGLVVLCAFISPFAADRQMVRDLLEPGEFIEIHVQVPIETAIARDPKGLYRRALAGEIRNFTGVDQAYEEPIDPELRLDTARFSAEELADVVVRLIEPS